MVEEREPAKRVVKRVVKKTVVRPAAPTEPAPTVRYGRPVATATKPTPKAKVASPKTATAKVAVAPKPPPERPRLDVGARLQAAGHRVSDGWWVVADAVRDGSGAAWARLSSSARAVAAWRLPHINIYLATVVTGAVVGLVAVVLGYASLQVFEQVRGVATGGGLWGGLAFIVIALIAWWLGSALLAGFGARSGRLTSLLGVVVTVVAILGLFLEPAQTAAAVVIIPTLSLASYTLAHWLIDLAERTPAEID